MLIFMQEWGAMMEELQHEEEETPLQENLEKLALLIGKIALVAASTVFLVLLIWWIATEAAHKPWEWGNIVDIVGFFIVSGKSLLLLYIFSKLINT
jgi:magnesium-transporting ATPase (P-type)